MNFAIGYCLYRAGYECVVFVKRWYGEGLRTIVQKCIAILERLDQTLALKITAKNLIEPLYKDKTFLGYLLGFVLRAGRIIVSVIIYSGVAAVGSIVCFLWLALPLFIVYQIVINYELTGNLL
ncbi:MAG: hypothetical protein A3H06_02475 [Candidatus Colwellbacteria bacterium RIFCSPLOWO2_12_FULL_44_13]|nr:MAG: hypothetical protein A3H06_02475 [Candidatus Colwellbacteria bacterium RIFCSPLOWO2_12_FULL_44_13]